MNKLTEKKCQACEGVGNPMNIKQVEELLKNVPGWKADEHYKVISRDFVTKNFMAAIKFINKIAELAEKDNHHPDIHLVGYRNLRIDLSTHAVGGVSENDFILAAKINELELME